MQILSKQQDLPCLQPLSKLQHSGVVALQNLYTALTTPSMTMAVPFRYNWLRSHAQHLNPIPAAHYPT